MEVPQIEYSSKVFPGGFTVLMAVYGKDDLSLFEKAVFSVYDNTLRPDAFILVVDGPVSIEMKNLIFKLQHQYPIKTIFLPFNQGLARALNEGLKKVKTTWVVRADADDYNMPNRFVLQANAISLKEERIDIISGAIQEVDLDGTPLMIRRMPETHTDIMRLADIRSPFNHMAVAFRTECALKCGGYPDIYLKEDYALWGQILGTGGRAMNLSEILVFATTGKEMYRRRGGWKYAYAEIALQKHLVKYGIKSAIPAFIHGHARALIFVLPTFIRSLVYRRLLRCHK
jgi:glycosyltransferase involved in cell wall biosynthesis